MAAIPLMERNARNVVALRMAARRGEDVGRDLEPVIADLRSDIALALPKAVAARLLGVSSPTLNKWISRGLIPVSREGQRVRVLRDPLLDLAEQVAHLRLAGHTDGVLAEVVHRLQARDPEYRAQAKKLYGDSLAAMDRGELIAAVVPETLSDDD